MLKKVLLGLLDKISNDIKTDNCNMSDEEVSEVIERLKQVSSPYMSKYQAYDYVGVSRATFDNLVKDGKLPKGIKRLGFKELFYSKYEIDEYIKKNKNR